MADYRFTKGEALPLKDLVNFGVNALGLRIQYNNYIVRKYWMQICPHTEHIIDVRVENNTIIATMDSSIARQEIFVQRNALLNQLNQLLKEDEYYTRKDNLEFKVLILR